MVEIWQFYFLLALLFLQGLLCLVNKKGLFLGICFGELFLIAGLRAWTIGNDTIQYVSAFRLIADKVDVSQFYMEKGYILFNSLVSEITGNPQGLLIVSSFFIMACWYFFIRKYSTSIFLSVLLFVLLCFSSTLSAIRQEMALGFVLLSLPFLQQRKLLPFLMCVLIATTFHMTAMIALIMYPLYFWKYNLRNILLILLGSVVCLVFLAPLLYQIVDMLGGRYGGYFGNRLLQEQIKDASIWKTLIHFTVAFFCIFSYQRFAVRAKNMASPLPVPFLLLMVLIGACIQMISIRGSVLERVAQYFFPFEVITLPFCMKLYPAKIQPIIISIVLGAFISYASMVFIFRPEWNHLFPYEFCF